HQQEQVTRNGARGAWDRPGALPFTIYDLRAIGGSAVQCANVRFGGRSPHSHSQAIAHAGVELMSVSTVLHQIIGQSHASRLEQQQGRTASEPEVAFFVAFA